MWPIEKQFPRRGHARKFVEFFNSGTDSLEHWVAGESYKVFLCKTRPLAGENFLIPFVKACQLVVPRPLFSSNSKRTRRSSRRSQPLSLSAWSIRTRENASGLGMMGSATITRAGRRNVSWRAIERCVKAHSQEWLCHRTEEGHDVSCPYKEGMGGGGKLEGRRQKVEGRRKTRR